MKFMVLSKKEGETVTGMLLRPEDLLFAEADKDGTRITYNHPSGETSCVIAEGLGDILVRAHQ